MTKYISDTIDNLIPAVVFATGLTLGYLAGTQQTTAYQVPQTVSDKPGNYDPARQLCNDLLTKQAAATESCWRQVVAVLDRGVKEVAHE